MVELTSLAPEIESVFNLSVIEICNSLLEIRGCGDSASSNKGIVLSQNALLVGIEMPDGVRIDVFDLFGGGDLLVGLAPGVALALHKLVEFCLRSILLGTGRGASLNSCLVLIVKILVRGGGELVLGCGLNGSKIVTSRHREVLVDDGGGGRGSDDGGEEEFHDLNTLFVFLYIIISDISTCSFKSL